MITKSLFQLLAVVGLSLLVTVSASAQRDTAPISGAFDIPMKSRTCGLVLLSEGRASARAGDKERGLADLIGAFALLQDGRTLVDKAAARTASQKMLTESPASKLTAISTCKNWLEQRKTQPSFVHTEEDQWNWVSQAQLTIETEKQ